MVPANLQHCHLFVFVIMVRFDEGPHEEFTISAAFPQKGNSIWMFASAAPDKLREMIAKYF